jgi:hypothetical protein
VRNVHDVEHAERDRNSGSHRGVKSAKQQPGDDCVDYKIEGNIHTLPNRDRSRRHITLFFRRAMSPARQPPSARQKVPVLPPLGPSVFDCLRQTIQPLPDRFSQFAGRLAAWLAC